MEPKDSFGALFIALHCPFYHVLDLCYQGIEVSFRHWWW
jgi:hypothetical protein